MFTYTVKKFDHARGPHTPGPLNNTIRYKTVLDITMITVGPQLYYFGYMSIHFTLFLT